MLGSGEQLFDHIAACLAKFTKEEQVQSETLPLGFTFSFPLTQKGLTKGYLERWTKGFNCSNVVGNDVVQMLEDAIARRGVRTFWNKIPLINPYFLQDVKIEVCAILNDTTGTLMSCAWKNPHCKIGLIVGRCNANTLGLKLKQNCLLKYQPQPYANSGCLYNDLT